jgi:hypothetical protein
MPKFMKILPVGAELFHADRRTDMTKLTVAIRNFANKPKNEAIFFRQRIRHLINSLPILAALTENKNSA